MIWVGLGRAAFGVVHHDGRVVDAAPYGKAILGDCWYGMDEIMAAAKLASNGAEFIPLRRLPREENPHGPDV